MAYHPLKELFLARAREFFREPEAIFWVYVFPLLLAVCLGIAFRTNPAESVRILVEETSGGAAEELAARLREDQRLQVAVKPPEAARKDMILGRADLVVRPGKVIRFILDATRAEGKLARQWANARIQEAAGRRDPAPIEDEPCSQPGSRYIDFLLPGLIGMNIMGGGLWGVGFVIVDMRVRKLLKRFLATPMRKRDFLLSVVGSRLVFLVPEITVLLLVGRFGFGVPAEGSYAALSLVVIVSALSFSGLGLLVASRANKIETVSGLMNVVMLPMWILSGIFFSAERFPDALQPFIQALPLTATIDSLRAVMLEGQPLTAQWGEFLILAAWGLASFALSLRWFRWV